MSVKTRIGFRNKETLEWTGFILGYNLAAITVHGRTAKNTVGIPADWEEIGKVVALRDQMSIDTCIIGNGDVMCQRQFNELHEKYGVDGIMVGRGVLRDPLIFRQPGNTGFRDLSVSEKAGFMAEHVALYREIWGSDKNFNVLKRFTRTYINGFTGAAHVRAKLMEADSYGKILKILESIQ